MLNNNLDKKWKYFKPMNINQKIKMVNFKQPKFEILNDNEFWKIDNQEFYPKWFSDVIENLKKTVTEFILNGYSRKYTGEYRYIFLRKFAYQIFEDPDVKSAYFHSFGRTGKIGLEIAKVELKLFQEENDRLPKSLDEDFLRLSDTCQRGTWKQFKIYTWNDLLKATFDEVNVEIGYYHGKSGLEKAKEEAVNLKRILGKIPSVYDENMSNIRWAISRGVWKEFNILIWHDFLLYSFKEIDFKPKKYYSGKIGLERAVKELKDFKEINNRYPTSKDQELGAITTQISRKGWTKYGISSWIDLVEYTFNIKWENLHSHYKYLGKNGLNLAQQEIKELSEKMNRIPRIEDIKPNTIINVISKNIWKEFGITSWILFLQSIFGKDEVKTNLYRGKIGLEFAQDKLKKYYIKYGKMPTTSSKGMGGVNFAANEGYWKEYEINNWSDLMLKTFKKKNKVGRKNGSSTRPRGFFKGLQGLDNARKIIENFYLKEGRAPRIKDLGMSGINSAIKRKEWENIGINRWSKLVADVMKRIKNNKNEE